MAFVAFLDACVLYPAVLRDVLLTVGKAGICQLRWSPDVLDEMQRNLEGKGKSGAAYLRQIMEGAFPDAMVERERYERLVPVMTNDEKDRHVLAAAISARADVLVTFNVRHFPKDACTPYGVEVQHPDAFLLHQFELAPAAFLHNLESLASERTKPPLTTVDEMLAALQKVTPQFAAAAQKEALIRRGGGSAKPN